MTITPSLSRWIAAVAGFAMIPVFLVGMMTWSTGCNAQHAGQDLTQAGAVVGMEQKIRDLQAENAALVQANVKLQGELKIALSAKLQAEASLAKAGRDIALLQEQVHNSGTITYFGWPVALTLTAIVLGVVYVAFKTRGVSKMLRSARGIGVTPV